MPVDSVSIGVALGVEKRRCRRYDVARDRANLSIRRSRESNGITRAGFECTELAGEPLAPATLPAPTTSLTRAHLTMSSDYEFSDYEYEDDEESMDVEGGM